MSLESATQSMLYHYTSEPGLTGILKEKKIWATKLLDFKDEKELEFKVNALKLFVSWFQERKQNGFGNPIWMSCLINLLNHQIYGKNSEDPPLFVVCFTKDGDSAFHWNEYGDNGKGFALGLSHEAVQEQFHLAKVIYKQDELEVKFQELWNSFNSKQPSAEATLEFFNQLMATAIAYKDEEFSKELEYRCFATFPNDSGSNSMANVRSRNNGDRSISFMLWPDEDLDPGLVLEIVLGPKNTLTGSIVSEMLTDAFGDQNQVKVSSSILGSPEVG